MIFFFKESAQLDAQIIQLNASCRAAKKGQMM